MDGSAIACDMKSDCALSDGQLAISTGRPTKANAVGGNAGDKLKTCS